MYYTYVLLSEKNHDMYIGSTHDIEMRLGWHNGGKVQSTKAYRPWKLLGYEIFSTRGEAMMQEKFLKNHQQKEILKKKYKEKIESIKKATIAGL
jgi:putative endonuclease